MQRPILIIPWVANQVISRGERPILIIPLVANQVISPRRAGGS
jgi:hypothetical protein